MKDEKTAVAEKEHVLKDENFYVALANKHRGYVENSRKEWEIRSYVNVMMKEGNHYVNDKGQRDTRDPNQLRRSVNKYRSTLRALKNSITYNAPMVDVLPERGEESIDQTELELASYICSGEYEKNNMRDKLATLVEDSALKSWAVWSVLPNDEADDDDERLTRIEAHDPFDVYSDNLLHPEKAQMFIAVSVEHGNYLRSQGYEELDGVQASQNKSYSALKNEFEAIEGRPTMDNMYLIEQVFMLDYETEDGEPNSKVKSGAKPKVVHFVKCGDKIIKKPKVLKGYKHLGEIFFVYYMEKSEHIAYPSPWMTDAVPLQRSLNDASENEDTLSHWFSKVRLLQNKADGNTVQMFEDKHVQKIAYEGQRPEIAVPPPVPQHLFQIVAQREAQIEDQVGMHSASLGKQIASGASGRMQALAKAADMDNVGEPTRNLNTFLSAVFKRVIEIASENCDSVMKFYGSDGEGIAGIGERAYEALEDKKKIGVKPIRKFTNVRATIIPGSMFDIMAAKQEILEVMPILVNAGYKEEAKAMFDVMLRLFTFGVTRDISKALNNKENEEREKNADIIIAQMEITKLMRGEPVMPSPFQDHELHVQLAAIALEEVIKKYGEDDPIIQLVKDYIAAHQSMIDQPKTEIPQGAGAPPPAPAPTPAPDATMAATAPL